MPAVLFLDSDVALDLLMQRADFYKFSAQLFLKIQNRKASGFMSATGFINTHYFLRKYLGKEKSLQTLKEFKTLVSIAGINDQNIDRALYSSFPDFEDAMQHEAALNCKADFILTRNLKHYKKSTLPVYTPEDYLKNFNS